MPVIHLDTIEHEQLSIYNNLTNRQLRSRLDPNSGLCIAESEKVIRVALLEGLIPASLLLDERQFAHHHTLIHDVCQTGHAVDISFDAGHLSLRERQGEPVVYVVPRDEICKLVGYEVTRGMFCALRRPLELDASKLLVSLPSAHRLAVLEGITDATNVGAAFRSAAALGVDAVLLSPTCCDPFVRRAIRVSMGTVFQVPWARLNSWPDHEFFSQRGFSTAALALTDESIALGEEDLRSIDKLALVFGTEGDGLSHATLEACDITVRIPMHHGVDSLNVAAATAVAFWELCH